jgi:hypothetical protein
VWALSNQANRMQWKKDKFHKHWTSFLLSLSTPPDFSFRSPPCWPFLYNFSVILSLSSFRSFSRAIFISPHHPLWNGKKRREAASFYRFFIMFTNNQTSASGAAADRTWRKFGAWADDENRKVKPGKWNELWNEISPSTRWSLVHVIIIEVHTLNSKHPKLTQ